MTSNNSPDVGIPVPSIESTIIKMLCNKVDDRNENNVATPNHQSNHITIKE